MRNIVAMFLLVVSFLLAAPVQAQTYPATDSFPGTTLSANWTNTTASAGLSYPPVPLIVSSGKVVPNTTASWGLAIYTGETFTATHYAQTVFVTHNAGGGWTGPCVQMSTAGTGYCWTADSGQVVSFYVGVWNAAASITCPIPASGDTIRLSISGSTLTCADITAGTSASGATVSGFYTAGNLNTGVMVDTRNYSGYALSSFQSDCIPTCSLGTVATPTFSPAAGSYGSAQTVTISSATAGATLHYTTDGSTPTSGSATYSSAITVAATETVKAIGIKTGYTNSAVGSAAYTITSGYPVTDSFSGSGALSSSWTNTTAYVGLSYPPVPLVKSSGKVVPNTATSWGLATYTASTFTADQYAQTVFVAHNSAGGWTGPCVQMSTAGTGYCWTADSGAIVSFYVGVWNANTGISCPIPATGDTIKLSVAGSTFTCLDVTTGVSASGPGTPSFYTVGNPGVMVDTRGSSVYALTSFQADCIPTCASGGGGTVATPTFSPAAGTYTSAQSVTISTTTTGSTIYYTTNGTTPTTGSAVYSSPISVSSTETVKALGVRSGYTNSAVGSAAYTINLTVATPTFSPVAGTYTSAQSVTISTSTSGSTIHYTTNGTTPTASSPTYSTPISVASTETVKALGIKTGYTNSAVGSAAYTINLTVATPTFSPAAGSYGTAQSVTISSATTGSTIYYTTNGTTPTTSSSVYSSPISVSTSETVKALGVKSGYTNSAIGSAAYVIGGTKTLSSIAISPQGASLKNGSSLQFSVVCTYSDNSTDNCTYVGGATWSSSTLTSMSVSSSGLATWNTDPGAGSVGSSNVVVKAGGLADRAAVYGQHTGDTWYQYPTPGSTAGSAAIGSTVTMGSAFSVNDASMSHTASPFQSSCNWSSSAPSVATVSRYGQVTAVAAGSATITCGRAGNAVFGNSTLGGWISPGNTTSFTVVAGGTSNTTWYVRPDGGTIYSSTNTAGQCTGKTNAAYPGTGVNQPCAASNIRNLWADGVTYYQLQWVISGGDTVIVAQNSAGYNTGLDQASPYQTPPGTAWVPINCAGNPGCSMPTIPSGTASRHTRILGANYASCHADSSKTLLHVSYAAGTAINVTDSQFVDIACFEITDEAACADSGNYTNNCHNSNLNYGVNGVSQSAFSSDDTYTDLFIHGLGGAGIYGASGVGIVGNYVHIRGMGSAGINMDDGPWTSGNISVSGGLTLTNSITEWTGCAEEYPVVHNYPYIECRDQNTGGYGDGFGTASTTGNWVFDHDTWQYNFQDGLDLLHSGMQELSVTNSLSLGNDGQAYKIGSADKVIFQNNIAMVNCNRIAFVIGDEPSSAIVPGVSTCRAGGDWMVFSFTDLGSYTVQNNTFVGYANTPFDFGCEGGWDSCSNAKSTYQNNLFMGYSDPFWNGGTLPGLFYQESGSMPPHSGWAVRDHNIFYNTRSGYCPTPLQTGESCVNDPLFVAEPASPITAESDLDGFNFKPSSSSPAVGAGIAIPGLTTDYTGATRPNPPSIGAIE